MTLKTQTSRVYRGLLWLGRFYRFVGWMGLAATAFFTAAGFVSQWQAYPGLPYGFEFTLRQALLLGFLIMITGLVLSAIAFGISLGIQVGLTMMTNSQTQIDLLRRLAQQQSEDDSVVRLQDPSETHEAPEQPPQSTQSRR